MGKSVLVVDASETEEIGRLLFDALPQVKDRISIVTQCGVDYTTSSRFLQKNEGKESYDFLLYYFGNQFLKEEQKGDLSSLDEIFALTFCDYQHLFSLRESMKKTKLPIHVILRNVTADRKNRKFFFYFLQEENAFVAEKFLLPFDEVDESYRIRAQYEVLSDFRDISSAMEKVLKQVLMILCPEETEAAKKAVTKAKKGVWI